MIGKAWNLSALAMCASMLISGCAKVTFIVLLQKLLPGNDYTLAFLRDDGPSLASLLLAASTLVRCAGGLVWLRFNEVIAGLEWYMVHCETLRTATLVLAAVAHLRIAAAMVGPHLAGGVWSVGWAELSYAVALSEVLAQFTLEDNSQILMVVIVGCVVGQVFSSLQLTAAQRLFGQPTHHRNCRCFQACHAFVAWSLQHSVFAGTLAALFTYGACPRLLLWLPILKRPAALMVDDQAALPMPTAKQRRGCHTCVCGLLWCSISL